MKAQLVAAGIVGCSSIAGCGLSSDGPVRLPHTCVVKANNPHRSTHEPDNINAEVTVECSEPVTDATVYARLEEQDGSGTWTLVMEESRGPRRVKANDKLEAQANTICRAGVFRTAGYAPVTNADGTFTSPTYRSRVVQDPCG